MTSLLKKKSLPKIHFKKVSSLKIGIAVSRWHPDITKALLRGAETTLVNNGIKKENIICKNVPGSFELPLAAQILLKKKCDAVICLGCIIKGETPHYLYISHAVSNGITEVSLRNNKPVGFGILTTDNFEQAKERAGGKSGNKGKEAAEAVLEMLAL